jgi:uncharacterized SAM-binding protein YcdF (DUF218 family)
MKVALIRKYTGWRLTWTGRLLIVLILIGLAIGAGAGLYPFLAPEKPPHEGLMVVEGWIHDFALDEAVALYQSGDYSRIICTGIPVETGSYIQDYASYPEMTAARLRKLGVDPEKIVVTVAEETRRDRTYAAAVALRTAFITYNIEETDLHLVTTGPHGRRSRMLFQKALGSDYRIGITCIDEYNYDSGNWYTSSEGVRAVIGELIAYLYAKLFFHP